MIRRLRALNKVLKDGERARLDAVRLPGVPVGPTGHDVRTCVCPACVTARKGAL